jgi:hypothetical protein
VNAEHDRPSVPRVFNCPMCGGDRWVGLGGEFGELIVPRPLALFEIDEDGKASTDTGYPVVGMACTTCGFVRLHSMDDLRK